MKQIPCKDCLILAMCLRGKSVYDLCLKCSKLAEYTGFVGNVGIVWQTSAVSVLKFLLEMREKIYNEDPL